MSLGLSLAIAAAIAVFVFASPDFRSSRELAVGGIVIGAVIVGRSGRIGYIAENPNTLEEAFVATNSGRAESFSFVAPGGLPAGFVAVVERPSKLVTFGIAGVLGMAAGSAAMALATGAFRWQGFACRAEDLVNHIAGGVLMGFGGVTALGCTIGQGLTRHFPRLALGSFIALAAIIARVRRRVEIPGVAVVDSVTG